MQRFKPISRSAMSGKFFGPRSYDKNRNLMLGIA